MSALPLDGLRVVEVAHWVGSTTPGRGRWATSRQTLAHDSGPFETVGPPFRIEGTPLGSGRAASAVNADLRAVFAEAGLSEPEIRELVREGDPPG